MSFVTAIRDYVEALNTISESLGQNFTLTNFVSETALYVLKTLQSGLFYIVSFQWIRDFTLLPIVLPQVSAAIFKESFFLETPSNVFFDFLEIPDLHQNKFLLGIFNSFFLTLPFSVVHIISVRRLLIKGIPSGLYSIGGYLVGQILFLGCTIFGIRQILIPWLTLEPLSYLVGIILIFRIIYSMTGENLGEYKDWKAPEYKTFFLTNLVLAWCEQTSVFQYLGNLTLSSNVTVLESFSTNSSTSSFFTHFIYLSGISCGCILFTAFWGFFFLQVKNWFILYTPMFLTSFIQTINKTTFILAVTLSLTSIPFYGFDYLMTGPLGFLSQDSIFKNTFFDQTRIKELKAGVLSGPESNYKYIEMDVASFDRGEYLTAPEFDISQALSFEDLNYRGEFDWTARQEKVSGITESRSGFFTLSKVFKKFKKNEKNSQSVELEKQDLNRLLSENKEGFDPTLLDTQSPTVQRFIGESELPYQGQENTYLNPYHQLYSTSFPADYNRVKSLIEPQIEAKIKQKYYSNPVYKTLLALDIDLFLKRQPQNFQLNAEQEVDLYTKRRMLESYYDSLRNYRDLPYSETFDSFFDGTKSFSNKVYNQQFKGTLRSVRRLFSLTINQDSDGAEQNVLKFDQPSYLLSEKQAFSPYHEELGNQTKQKEIPFPGTTDYFSKPFYAGWDDHVRKFVITNKFLPRDVAGYNVTLQPEIRRNFSQESAKQGQKITFTAWPLSLQTTQVPKKESSIPYVTLFEILSDETKNFISPDVYSSTLPANLERYERTLNDKKEQPDEIFSSLAPKRGGFIWPGNSKINNPFGPQNSFLGVTVKNLFSSN